MHFRIFIVCLSVFSMDVFSQVGLGDKVPNFEATDYLGNTWKLNKNLDGKYLVIYFYPAAFTGGCTKQACSYRDDKEKLVKAGASVVGISGDNAETLRFFAAEHHLNFPLLSDENGEIARLFDVPVGKGGTFPETINGKKLELKRNISIHRYTFILDKRGRLIYKDAEADPALDSKKVVEFLTSLK